MCLALQWLDGPNLGNLSLPCVVVRAWLSMQGRTTFTYLFCLATTNTSSQFQLHSHG